MTDIDITRLPPPDVIEPLNYERILARKKRALLALLPEDFRPIIAATLSLESDPLTKDLEQQAYNELILRQRINEAARASMLAFAAGHDLDHFGASRNLARKIIQSADSTTDPPTPEVRESDADYRRRLQLHPEKYTTCGTVAAYRAHALDVADVADAAVISPGPGQVSVYIKSYASAVASASLVGAVGAYLSAEERRPLCDTVAVFAATPKDIIVRCAVDIDTGASAAMILPIARSALNDLIRRHTGIGASLALSKIIGALDVEGVRKITLTSPDADIVCAAGEYIRITEIQGLDP